MRHTRLAALGTAVITAALLGSSLLTGTGTATAQSAVTVQLTAQNNSGQSGTATLTPVGSQTMVTLNLRGGPAGPQPAHIHTGRCPNVGAVVYPLTNVVSGMSETTVDASLSSLMNGNMGINVHRSAQESTVYTSCGTIPAAAAATAGQTGGKAGGAAPAPAKAPGTGAAAPSQGPGTGAAAPAPAKAPGTGAAAPSQGPGTGAAAPAKGPGTGAAAPAQAPRAGAAAPAQAPSGGAAPSALPRTGEESLPLAGLALVGLASLSLGLYSRRRSR